MPLPGERVRWQHAAYKGHGSWVHGWTYGRIETGGKKVRCQIEDGAASAISILWSCWLSVVVLLQNVSK